MHVSFYFSGNDSDYYLQIADQKGNALDIPKEERQVKSLLESFLANTCTCIYIFCAQALTLAMTLHEKGKALLKKKEHADALYLLLEADKEFK